MATIAALTVGLFVGSVLTGLAAVALFEMKVSGIRRESRATFGVALKHAGMWDLDDMRRRILAEEIRRLNEPKHQKTWSP